MSLQVDGLRDVFRTKKIYEIEVFDPEYYAKLLMVHPDFEGVSSDPITFKVVSNFVPFPIGDLSETLHKGDSVVLINAPL